MKSRNISDDEFLRITRGAVRYKVSPNGELSHHKQDIGDLELHFATTFKNGIRVTHLRITTKWDKRTLTKPTNLVLANENKKDLYNILKSLSYNS